MPSFLPQGWKPQWERLIRWTPIIVAIIIGVGGVFKAFDEIAAFFGLSGEKEVRLEIRELIPVLNSSYETEGDVVLGYYIKKTGQKTAINCRIQIHADGRPLQIISTNYGDSFSLPAGSLERKANVTVTPFEPDSRGARYNRRWNEVRTSVICDGGIASPEDVVASQFLRSDNFYKKKKD